MIKRMNKVTSLLVAAAAVMSLVPATAVNAAERLETKAGTIDSAIAFDGGNYIYDGYKTSNDATGVYYNAEDKDKLLEDFNADSITKYGDKYAKVMDGSDEYVVDLSTGKVVEDETTAEDKDAAQAKLATALKKTDRYSSAVTKTSDLDGKIDQILKGQFGEVWYQYNTSTNASVEGEVKGEVDVVADTNWTTLKVGDKTFAKNDSTPVSGYISGADFLEKVRANATIMGAIPAGFAISANDSTTGKITLTQTAPANYTQADADKLTGNINATLKVTTPGAAGAAVAVVNGQPKQYSMKSATTITTTVSGTPITALANIPVVSGYSAAISVGNDIITYTEVADGEGKFTGTTFTAPTLYDGATKINAVAQKGYKFTTTTTFASTSGGAALGAAPAVAGYTGAISGNVITYTENAVAGVFTDVAFVAPTLYDGTTKLDAVANTTGVSAKAATLPVKAVIEITPDLTKDVSLFGTTIYKNADVVSGFKDAAGFTTQLKAAVANGQLGNYEIKDNAVTISNGTVKFTLVQKTGADLNQANVGFGGDGVTAVVTKNGVVGNATNVVNGFIGFSNQTGNYIDASYIANMYVYSKATDTIKKIENFGKEDKDTKLKVDLVSLKAISQDKDYIYAIATVNVTGDGATSGTQYFFQKISKARGDQKDGAYLPKSVTSYQITDAYDSGNADDAVTSINEAQDIRVINDVIYATKNASDKVTVTTIKLKKDKVAVDGGTKKIDTYLAEQDVQEGQDIAGANAVSIDVDGNTWAINKGEILKFDGTKFTTVYNCDRTFDTLEVYNADSLIAWKAGDDVFTTVSKAAAVETPVETPVQNKGWVKTTAGWTFYNNDGSQTKGQWVQDGGVWYMIKADGIMATGWYNDHGTWYYLAGSGAMQTGWYNDHGTWYYLAGSGAMQTGWYNDHGTWYYLNGSGAMLSNTVVDGYKLGASGAWVK